MLDYNVPLGKLNRGMAVLDVCKAMAGGREVSADETFKANALGWCIEFLQAFFLVADDIMDNSITRRGQPCWYRQPQVRSPQQAIKCCSIGNPSSAFCCI
jgi:farnesyl diphosphate synthase